MANSLTVACVQNCAGPDIDANLDIAGRLTRQAAQQGAELVCLPEYFSALDLIDDLLLGQPFPEASHPTLSFYQKLAKELGVGVLLGSLAVSTGGERFNNRSYLLGRDGEILARYDKIHLFDVKLAGGEDYLESGTVEPGHQAVVAESEWGSIGLTICYDLRFAQLYRALAKAGAIMLTIPAAFTKTTGQAHWHSLIRARAIETGCFVFAPCQYGEHGKGRACYGHSLIVDPWGKVLADGGEDEGIVLAKVDLDEVARVRGMVPSLQHDRDFVLSTVAKPGAAAAE